MRHYLILLSLLILLVTGSVQAAPLAGSDAPVRGIRGAAPSDEPQPQAPALNLLQNPSFEGQYSAYIPPNGHPDCPSGICQTAQMAAGWTPWWVSHNPDDPPHIIRMPEYKPAEAYLFPYRVHSGERAQQYFTFFSTHRAGFYQRAAVTAGETYCFRIWTHAWSSSGPLQSDSTLYLRVGLDPTGGEAWDSPNVIWGPTIEQYDVYDQTAICGVAQSDHVTVFTFSEPMWAVQHNDVYWDDAELVPGGGQIEASAAGFTFLAGIDAPRQKTARVHIELPSGYVWLASAAPGGTLEVGLSAPAGWSGTDLLLTVDTNEVPPGTYTTEIVIQASPDLVGSPITIPVTLVVVDEVHASHLPLLRADDTAADPELRSQR